jgi:hypothetical protein
MGPRVSLRVLENNLLALTRSQTVIHLLQQSWVWSLCRLGCSSPYSVRNGSAVRTYLRTTEQIQTHTRNATLSVCNPTTRSGYI